MKLLLAERDPQHHSWAKSGVDRGNMKLRILLSYHYYKDTHLDALFEKYFTQPYPEVFADSGAFSAASQGAQINIPDYAAWVKRWAHLLTTYANLDVIGDADATDRNQKALEDLGLEPLPVFHTGSDMAHLEKLVERYQYIALGGMVPFMRFPKRIMPWLIKCFKMAQGKAVFHGFGATSWTVVKALPWYSVDSSSWGKGFRYGQVPVFDVQAGKFQTLNLGNVAEWQKHSRLVEALGFDWRDFADRNCNDRAKICAISALSYMMAEQWLGHRHGEIFIPGGQSAPGRWALLVTADSTSSNMGMVNLSQSLREYGLEHTLQGVGVRNQVIGQPVKFVGVGEKYDAIEPFYPDRIAQSILGMDDVLSLIEEAQGKIDEKEAQEQLRKLTTNQFTLEDFRNQLGQFKKLGSMSKLMKMLPEQMTGGLQITDEQSAVVDHQMKRTEAIIDSMTRLERTNYKVIDASRKTRIARGSGSTISEVNQLLRQYEQMRKMMAKMTRGGLLGGIGRKMMGGLAGGLGGLLGGGDMGLADDNVSNGASSNRIKRKKRHKKRRKLYRPKRRRSYRRTKNNKQLCKAFAKRLINEGHIVYGAARRVDQMQDLVQAGGRAIALDITADASISAAVEQVIGEQGRIDVLINNAGYAIYGAVEETTLADARRQFEVNIFGLGRITQLVVPHMRKQKKGRIINVSSMGGKMYTPLGAWYHATKFALEALSDCLRTELAPFGIDVVIIEPGGIRTEWPAIAADKVADIGERMERRRKALLPQGRSEVGP